NNKIKLDAAIGIVTTAMFALGVAMVSTLKNFRQNFEAALFGNILGITGSDLLLIGMVGLVTLVVMFFSYRSLLFSTFDPEAAQIFGVKRKSVQLLFSLLLTFSVIASLNVIGVTLVAATLIAPAMTARMLTDSFGRMLLYSGILGATSNVIGMYLSYMLNVASGTTIVLFSALVFVLSLMIKPFRGH
ncbi:MAG: metal ABC transporter permease, partial [Nitrosomonas sp.]|nr:metal ABC transporter permease [Nitrosomonas sp.]